MLLLLLGILLILQISGAASSNSNMRFDNICGQMNNRRIYVELGELGHLKAEQIGGDSLGFNKNQTIHNECNLEVISCPSCIINVKFALLNISRNCEKTSVLDNCGCDYLWLYEPRFESSSGEQFCGYFLATNTSSLSYRGQTRSIVISYMFINLSGLVFQLEYTSERNRYNIDGYPRHGKVNAAGQQITSPFFPSLYPRDLSVEYVINCKTSIKCRIRIVFTDFQISTTSLIEFFDWNGQRMEVATGSLFRPPIVITTGPSITIRFYANGGTNLGFKAVYHYFIGDVDVANIKPNIDCGGLVSNLGGVINMSNVINDSTKLYDCFWILKPPDNYFHQKTHLYLKVLQFSNLAGNAELMVHQGITSNEPVVEASKHPVSHFFNSKHKEHVVTITEGFYIGLRGSFRPESAMAIAYSAFSYKDTNQSFLIDCFSETDFLCRNHRCIPAYLTCDSFDHCGDNSDEPLKCVREQRDSRWLLSHNFYFPKMYKNSNIKLTTVIFIVCSLGLISLIFALVFILYRINMRNRTRNNIQSHLQAINDLLGDSHVTEEIISINDDPPIYEAPPDYEDVIREFKPPRRMSRSNRNIIKNHHNTSHMENMEQNEEASTSRSCQTTPQPIAIIPDSPPPLYISLNLDQNSRNNDQETNENENPPTLENVEESSINSLFLKTLLNIDIKLRRSFMKSTKTSTLYQEQSLRLSDTQLYTKSQKLNAEVENYELQRSNSIENLYLLK